MSNAYYRVPEPKNEPVLNYAPGSSEREALKAAIAHYKSQEWDLPMYINGEWVTTGEKVAVHPPHEIAHTLGYFHKGNAHHVNAAISAALAAQPAWEAMPWQDRAAIFLKAADLISVLSRSRKCRYYAGAK
ncbi:MAG: aldehyde dehydrogenase family protein [Saprospiraceae bacterium]